MITLNSTQVRPWFIAFFAITALQNVLTTSMSFNCIFVHHEIVTKSEGILILRIWRVERESERYLNRSMSSANQPRHLRKVIRVIAESGAAYTLMVFITAIVAVSQSNAVYPMSDMVGLDTQDGAVD